MCYHYSLKAQAKELERKYRAKFAEEILYAEKLHVSSFEKELTMPVISSTQKDLIQYYKWGLIPGWAKERVLKYNTTNAQIEGIEEKPTWRNNSFFCHNNFSRQ